MNIPLLLGIIGVLGFIYIWIGKNASKNLQSVEDYFLMGRKITFFPLMLTLLATQLGGGTLMGASEEAYEKGWCVLFYPLGMSLGFIMLGLGFGAKLRKLNISTTAEVFEKIYQSKNLRKFASGLSMIGLFFIFVAQAIAAKKFFFAIGIVDPKIFILFWSVLIAYTVMGGMKAVVNTDVLQALFILFTLGLALFSLRTSDVSFIDTAPYEAASASSIPWTMWLFMPFLFMLIEQDMGQRCFAAKNSKTIFFSTIVAAVFIFLSAVVAIYFGILAKKMGIVGVGNTSILIEVVKILTNPTVSTFFIAGILMAVISTADSLLCSISSNLTCDFLSSKKIEEKKKIAISRVATLFIGLTALSFAFLFDNVLSMLMFSYELSVCLLFVPIFLALILKRPSCRAAFGSIVFGGIGFVLFRVFEIPFPKEMATIALSFGGYLLGQLSEKRIVSYEVNP